MNVASKCRQIEGWFSLEATLLFAWIDELQRGQRITGDLFEIGVHRGRSAILLSHLLQPGESLGVCDLFGEQTGNVSRSGSGDLAMFEANMRQFGAGQGHLRVFAKSSSLLSSVEIGVGHRFFHIDGGHNADEALSDLRLAAECVVPSGVIIVDDPFRSEWPGVTEAVIRFLDERPDFGAVAVGFNKLLLAKKDAVESYGHHIDNKNARRECGLSHPWQLKNLAFVGRPLRIFYLPTRFNPNSVRARIERLRRSWPWARSAAVGRLLNVVRRFFR